MVDSTAESGSVLRRFGGVEPASFPTAATAALAFLAASAATESWLAKLSPELLLPGLKPDEVTILSDIRRAAAETSSKEYCGVGWA